MMKLFIVILKDISVSYLPPFPLYFCTNMPNACFFNPSKTKDLLSFTTIDPNRYAGDYLSWQINLQSDETVH